MDAERKFINVGTLAAKVENSDLRIGDTTVETGFRVWLWKGEVSSCLKCFYFLSAPGHRALLEIRRRRRICGLSRIPTYLVLAVAITSRWASCHLNILSKSAALLANDVEERKEIVVR